MKAVHLDLGGGFFGGTPLRLPPPTLTRWPQPAPAPTMPLLHALIVVVPSLGDRKYHLDRGVIRVARDAWAMIRAGLAREYRLASAGAYGTDAQYEVVGVTGRAAP